MLLTIPGPLPTEKMRNHADSAVEIDLVYFVEHPFGGFEVHPKTESHRKPLLRPVQHDKAMQMLVRKSLQGILEFVGGVFGS